MRVVDRRPKYPDTGKSQSPTHLLLFVWSWCLARVAGFLRHNAFMHEREGVIKFSFEKVAGAPRSSRGLADLSAWREVLVRLGLLGCDPRRYGGLGFGNVSLRLPGKAGFLISGSQTGHLLRLGPEHWVEVLEWDPGGNFLRARGDWNPSAESMTHAAVYDLDPRIRCVLHGHSPEIFAVAGRLGLPATAADVPYGTPEMAREVGRLYREGGLLRSDVFVMAGHEDGVIAYGTSAERAGSLLVRALARAISVLS